MHKNLGGWLNDKISRCQQSPHGLSSRPLTEFPWRCQAAHSTDGPFLPAIQLMVTACGPGAVLGTSLSLSLK